MTERSGKPTTNEKKVLRILFWNINKKDLCNHICGLARETFADIIIVIESITTETEMLNALKLEVSSDFYLPESVLGRFQLFSRNANLDLKEVFSSDRVSLRRLRYAGIELTLGAVHVVDRWNWDEHNQMSQVALLASDILKQERDLGHNRTIIVGDFNMNPFDKAMNMVTGLNAMMTPECVKRGSRKLQGKQYPFFYNPMWSLLGDRSPGPAGTYYHTSSTQGLYGWNMLDQVLLRPSVVPMLENVQILNATESIVLHKFAGRPNKTTASDHFPILVTLRVAS